MAQFLQGADADVLPTCPSVLASAPPLQAMLLSQLEFEGDCSSTGERQRWESASWGWGVNMIWMCERCKGHILNIQNSKNVCEKRYENKCSKPVLIRARFHPESLDNLKTFADTDAKEAVCLILLDLLGRSMDVDFRRNHKTWWRSSSRKYTSQTLSKHVNVEKCLFESAFGAFG